MLDVVERVGCEHERIVARDVDDHVAHTMSWCAPHGDSCRDRFAVAHRVEPIGRIEQRDQPSTDVVGRVGSATRAAATASW